ncbi:MAG TPA: hypothetical protein VHQ89_02215 [Gaiellaceae bacterium]|jgi:hypothetical protein|nr:hypothetical protein [Gaiellaceae bacterium]
MRGTGLKVIGVAAGLAAAGVLIGLYVAKLTTEAGSASYTVPVTTQGGHKVVDLRIETVAAVGPQLSPGHPDYVSYLVRDTQGKWLRRTVWRLPADATVHVTIYNFDGASGLRNPLYARPQGVDGNVMTVDGKTLKVIPPDDASHTFAVPAYGLVVPVAPVADDAKNQCDYAPCAMSTAHRTIQFTFHTGKRGHYRWQCFVPCAAGWIDGFGGPMQTIGYMDGFLNVV